MGWTTALIEAKGTPLEAQARRTLSVLEKGVVSE